MFTMGTLRILVSLSLLCCFTKHTFARSKKWVCELGGREGKTEPFFRKQQPFLANLPCRYKMANVACEGDQTEVYVDRTLDSNWDNNVYITGVVVNITTTNTDGSLSYQQLRLDNVKLKQYEEGKDFTASPWVWDQSGSSVEEAKKILGRYDVTAQKAEVTVGKLSVLFTNVLPWQRRRHDKPTLEIVCAGSELKAFEGYPATACGGPDNSEEDVVSLVQEMLLDQHHEADSIRDAFALFTKQHVQQTDALCMEMQTMVQAQQEDTGEALYNCNEFFTSWGQDSRKQLCDGDTNRFKLYVMCMRVLANSDDGTMQTEQSTPETCQFLQQAALDCQNKRDFHLQFSQLLNMAGCPGNSTQPAPVPETQAQPAKKNKENRQTCKAKDIKASYWNRFSRGDVSTFFGRDDINIELPCRFQMTNIFCGGVQSEVFAYHSFDEQGHIYISRVKVTVTVRHHVTIRNITWLVLGNHFNSVTNKGLKQFIEKQDFGRAKGPWKHKRQGGPEPEGDNRIFHLFDQTTNSAVLIHRNLTVTYKYFDVSDPARPEQDVLTVTCSDPHYEAEEGFPNTVCGGRKDALSAPDDIVDAVPADPHHKYYNNDILILASQKRKQDDALCQEAKDIVSTGGPQLGEVLLECFLMYRTSPTQNTYGRCLRQKKINPFELYVTCLRVLSGGREPTSLKTCRTLREVQDACGHSVEDPHMDITELTRRAGCGGS